MSDVGMSKLPKWILAPYIAFLLVVAGLCAAFLWSQRKPQIYFVHVIGFACWAVLVWRIASNL